MLSKLLDNLGPYHGMFGDGSGFTGGGAGSVLASTPQYFSVTMAAGETTHDTVITAVVLANSVVVCLGYEGTTAAGNAGNCKVAFTSTTNVRATRNTAAATSTKVTFMVLEFAAGRVNSNQDVDIALAGAATNTQTITSVDITKAVLFPRGSITNDAGVAFEEIQGRLILTSATVVTANRNSTAAASLTMSGTVVEFK